MQVSVDYLHIIQYIYMQKEEATYEKIRLLIFEQWFTAGRFIVAWLSIISTMSKYIMGIVNILLLIIGLVKAAMIPFKIQEAET